MAVAQEGFLRAFTAGADFTTHEGKAVVGSGATVVIAGANVRALGILADNVKSGRAATVQVAGMARAVAGAAVAQWALLATNASGQLITATTGQNVVAQALEAASGAGVIFAVEVFNGGGGLA